MDFVYRKVWAFMEAGIAAESIALIASYAAQVRFFYQQLGVPGLEIDSVHGFQGREKEAVNITLVVSSNPEGEIRFLADVRRMNVAVPGHGAIARLHASPNRKKKPKWKPPLL